MADSAKPDPRLCVCLILDDEWVNACPHGLRYLQLGLVDAAVEIVVVAPEGRKLPAIVGGAGPAITYELGNWLTRRAQLRSLSHRLRERLTAMKSVGTVIAHGFGPMALPIAAELLSDRDGGIVITLDGGESNAMPRLGIRLDRPPIILAPSEPIRKRLIANHAGPRIEVAALGVPADATPAAFDHDTAEASIIFAGRLSNRGRLELLLRAMKRVLLTIPNAMLFIAGKGPAEPSLRQLVESLGIAASVIFAGRLEPIRSALQSADIFCLPNWDGRWSEELIEAMAVGLAIVAPENGPCEALRHAQTALLFPEQDEFRLAEHIERLIQDRTMARQVATAAQAAARAEYPASRMVEQHLALYRELASRDKMLKLDAGR